MRSMDGLRRGLTVETPLGQRINALQGMSAKPGKGTHARQVGEARSAHERVGRAGMLR